MLENTRTAIKEWLSLHKVALLIGFIVGLALGQVAHAQTISASPLAGTGSVTSTITYTVPAGGSCVASGGSFTGTKTASGTQSVTITSPTTFSWQCTVTTASGDAVVTWTPATQNTDGTAITNLTGHKVYAATSSAGVASATPVTVASPATTYTFASLAAGTWYFGAKTVAGGVDSVMSNIPSKVIAGVSATTNASVTVDVTKQPNAPTGVAATQTQAWTVELDCKGFRDCIRAAKADRYRLNEVVGSVPIGTACKTDFSIGDYYRVDRKAVQFTKRSNSAVIVAQCA